jgi:hypothetical protein
MGRLWCEAVAAFAGPMAGGAAALAGAAPSATVATSAAAGLLAFAAAALSSRQRRVAPAVAASPAAATPAPTTPLHADISPMTPEPHPEAGAAAEIDAAQARVRLHEERAAALSTDVAEFAPVITVMDRHLCEAVDATEAAAMALFGRLESLQGRVAALLDGLTAAGRDTGEVIEAWRVELTREIDAIEAQIRHTRAASRDGALRVTTFATGLRSNVAEVQELAQMIHMVAINARIEASRAGDAGRSFAVIAEEVTSLSRRSHDVGERIATGLEEVARLAGEASQDIVAGLETGTDGGLADVARRLAAHDRRLDALMDRQRAQIGVATIEADAVADITLHALSEAQFQDIVRQKIDAVRGGLDALAERSARAAAALGDVRIALTERDASLLDGMSALYTMESQRAAHGAAPAAGGAAAVAIELF